MTPQHQMASSAPYPDDMMQQAEEQQSIYRDAGTLNQYEPEDYHNPNPRKRVNTETSENPKKRAAVAVSHAICASLTGKVSDHLVVQHL